MLSCIVFYAEGVGVSKPRVAGAKRRLPWGRRFEDFYAEGVVSSA
jgi:hypothetical protein